MPEPLEFPIKCKRCGHASNLDEVVEVGFVCPGCGDRICIHCGCTETVACFSGCHWIALGACSTHSDQLWAAMEKTFGRAA
jgi:hypothetical protein